MDGLLRDVRFALRLMRRAPGFTAAALVTLALGIGASTAIFGVVNAVLVRPLPYPAADRLVRVYGVDAKNGFTEGNLSGPDVFDLAAATRTLDALGAAQATPVVLSGSGEPERVLHGIASHGFFQALRVQPALGRLLMADDETIGKHRVAVVTHDFWTRRLGGDPQAPGRTFLMNDVPYTVVGVLPETFRMPVGNRDGEPQFFRPLPHDPDSRGGHWLPGIARLADGATIAQAQAEMDALAQRLAEQYPDSNKGHSIRLAPLQSAVVGPVRPALVTLTVAVALLLVVGCANVAGLVLARAASRRHEMAVRAALGAGRWRMARMIVTETLILGLLGGAGGLLLALWGTDLVVAASAGALPRAEGIGIDARVFGFALLLSLLTGALCGLAPALRPLRRGIALALQGASGVMPRDRAALRSLLVVAQMAMSIALLAGAGLTLRSLARLLHVDPGFVPGQAAEFEIALPAKRYPEQPQINAFYDGLWERLARSPRVVAAGSINALPLSGSSSCDGFAVPEHANQAGEQPCAEARYSSPGYFAAMGIPLLRGRLIQGSDGASSKPVALINQAMARRFFAGEEPLGRHIVYNGAAHEIVGIVGDVRHFTLARAPEPEYYLPHSQVPSGDMEVVVRTRGGLEEIGGDVRAVVRELDPALPAPRLRPLDALVGGSVARPRFRALLLALFAAQALLLAAVGLYGLVAYSVAQRTREIGLRMALGAGRGRIAALVMGQGARLAVAGAGLGLLLAPLLTLALRSELFGVGPFDGFTFASVALILAVVALLACYLPARRAARIDPMAALRSE